MKWKLDFLVFAGFLSGISVLPASAGPRVPKAHEGNVKTETRFYSSGHVFSSSKFGFKQLPSTSRFTATQLKIVGEHGLGGKWAIFYDLRTASLHKQKKHRSFSTFGLQDQTIGIERGFRQGDGFADAVDLKFVVPTGPPNSTPQLGVGHFAVEPDYQFGFMHRLGSRFVSANFSFGPRVFTDSGVTQLQSSANVGGRLMRRVNVFGTFFSSRSLGGNPASAVTRSPNASEFYDVVRVGGGVEFSLFHSLRPVVHYETDIAGQGIHAGTRISFGMKWYYKRLPF